MKDAKHAARSNSWARASKLWGMKSTKPGTKCDERCRTMKGQVGGVLEEFNKETTVEVS